MSQQSNPATLREALTKLVANWRAEHGRYPIKGCGSCADELEAALEASGTEAAPPVRSVSSKTTENGLRDVGTVTRAQVSSAEGSVATSTPESGPRPANHLEHVQRFLTEMYQVMVDPVEEFSGNIEQLCAVLIARAKQDREMIHGRGRGERYLTEHQKAVEEAAGMNLDWNMAAGYAAAASLPQASPEGEGRETAEWWHEATLDVCRHARAHDPIDWQSAIKGGLLRAYNRGLDARQSAAPSGPLGTPSKLDGSMATAPINLSAAYTEFEDYFVRNYPGPDTIIHKPKWHAPKIFQAVISALKLNDAIAKNDATPLVRPGETGAVTETK